MIPSIIYWNEVSFRLYKHNSIAYYLYSMKFRAWNYKYLYSFFGSWIYYANTQIVLRSMSTHSKLEMYRYSSTYICIYWNTEKSNKKVKYGVTRPSYVVYDPKLMILLCLLFVSVWILTLKCTWCRRQYTVQLRAETVFIFPIAIQRRLFSKRNLFNICVE